MLLDRWTNSWQFNERHSIEVRASAEAIQKSIRELTPAEIPLVQVLLWLRRPFQKRTTNAMTILESAQAGRFVLLEDTTDELVIGLAGRFWAPSGGRVRLATREEFQAFETNGFAKATVNFRINSTEGNRFRITTETRIATFGRGATLKFGLYWWPAVRWGSGWIRMLCLRAIRRRAETHLES